MTLRPHSTENPADGQPPPPPPDQIWVCYGLLAWLEPQEMVVLSLLIQIAYGTIYPDYDYSTGPMMRGDEANLSDIRIRTTNAQIVEWFHGRIPDHRVEQILNWFAARGYIRLLYDNGRVISVNMLKTSADSNSQPDAKKGRL